MKKSILDKVSPQVGLPLAYGFLAIIAILMVVRWSFIADKTQESAAERRRERFVRDFKISPEMSLKMSALGAEQDGNYDIAIERWKQLFKLNKERHGQVDVAYYSLKIGKLYAKKGDKFNARMYFLNVKSIYLKEELGVDSPEVKNVQDLIDKLE